MLFDHVPWLANYGRKFPSSAEGYYNFRRIAVSRIEARQQGGAHTRDLMYYIVSVYSSSRGSYSWPHNPSQTNEDIGEERPPITEVIADGILVRRVFVFSVVVVGS